MNRVRLLSLVILLALLGGTFNSCAVFEAIGDSLSQLYDNSVSYFNAYYNAQRVFEEAEVALITSQREAEAKAIQSQKPPVQAPIPRDKFNSVIDKCSSILTFYPKSAVADDAVLLIGKSYYYLQDYLKAERKYSELLTQYPNSPLVLEGQLWFAKTLERLRRQDEAEAVAQQVALEAAELDEQDILAEVYLLLGSIAEQEGDTGQAVTFYTKAVEYISDGYVVASTFAKLGDLNFALNEYERANTAYRNISEKGVPDISLSFYGRIQAIRGYSALKKYDTAIFLAEEMLDDYRFLAYHPWIRLEYAGVFLASGSPEEAVSEYQYMDTTYARTESGARASFRLAEYYEHQRGDYSRAASYYSRAASVLASTVAPSARKRENALLRIISLRRELFRNDSLTVLSDSARQYPQNFLVLAPVDTALIAEDSTDAPPDSMRVDAREPQYITTFKPLDPDSMRTLRARAAYDMGEIYYAEIELPDSALFWFQNAWDWKVDSTRAPRTLFILAELKKELRKSTAEEIAQMHNAIIRDYPWSSYAHEVRRITGMPTTQQTTEQIDRAYAAAESLLWAGEYFKAIEQFNNIVVENRESEIAAKSQYAIGWIYEHKLAKPDSALIFYRLVSEQYRASPYAAAVKNKLAAASEHQQDGKDLPPQPGIPGEPQEVQPGQNKTPVIDDEGPIRRRVPQGRRTPVDTLKVKVKDR